MGDRRLATSSKKCPATLGDRLDIFLEEFYNMSPVWERSFVFPVSGKNGRVGSPRRAWSPPRIVRCFPLVSVQCTMGSCADDT